MNMDKAVLVSFFNGNTTLVIGIAVAVVFLIFHKIFKSVLMLVIGVVAIVALAGYILYNAGFYFNKNDISITDGNTTFTLPESVDTHKISEAVRLYNFVSTMSADKMLEELKKEYPNVTYDEDAKVITIKQGKNTTRITMYDVGKFFNQERYFYKVSME